MEATKQQTSGFFGNLAQAISLLMQSLRDCATNVMWTVAEHYDYYAPVVIVRICAAVIKQQTAFVSLFDSSVPLSLRMRRVTPAMAAFLVVLVLMVAPASAVYQLAMFSIGGDSVAFASASDAAVSVSDSDNWRTALPASGNNAQSGLIEIRGSGVTDNDETVISALNFDIPADSELPGDVSDSDAAPEDVQDEFPPGTLSVAAFTKFSNGPVLIGLPNSDEDMVLQDPLSDTYPTFYVGETPDSGPFAENTETTVGQSIASYDTDGNAAESVSSGIYIWPTSGNLTSRFGPRNVSVGSRNHKGIDICGPMSHPIYAAAGGEVIYSGWESGFGNVIRVRHENDYVTLYAHCSELLVSVGDTVQQGQEIAHMGRTGIATGIHLHFEVIINGINVDPLLYLP